MPTMSTRNWRVRSSSGMSLTELLVAMMILLVGIYAVVTGFPSLFRNIEGERVRTEMARVCENTIERLKTSPEMVPEAIAGHAPVAPFGVINPYSERDDAASVQLGNSHDDLGWVLGMTINVPSADVGQSVAVYPLALGPASSDQLPTSEWAMQGAARELVSLDCLNQPPAGVAPAGTFYVDTNGLLNVPSGYDAGMVDYCWVETNGTAHYVWDEYVSVNAPATGIVRAASLLNFANVIPSSCAARGAIEHYPILCGTAADVGANNIILEQTYGALLLLPRSMAGAALQIDYALKSEDDTNGNPRRTPVMAEEVPAPTVEPYQVDLGFRNLDDENPLYTMDMTDVALSSDVFVLIVDTQNGRQWTNNSTFVTLDMVNGKVTLDWSDASSPMTAAQARGHELRIYYRTLDGQNVQIMRAPRFFVEDVVAATYHAAGQTDAVDYREFSASSASVGVPLALITTLTLPASMAGMAVSVDYLHGTSAPYARVCNEVHVVDATTFTVVLNEPNVQAIVAVQGLTLKARAWWETQTGRVEKLDVDTFLTPESLL